MFNSEKKVTLEWVKSSEDNRFESYNSHVMSNPINNTDKLTQMVETILNKELPMLIDNSLLHDLVLYVVVRKLKTVQTVENVLSYIKENNLKQVHDISFKNGEVRIKCST